MKRLVAAVAAVAATAGLTVRAAAGDWTLEGSALSEEGGAGWVLKVAETDGGHSVVGVTAPGSTGVIDLRGAIAGGTVVSIGDSAFKGRSDITEFDMPDTVTAIGSDAFRQMPALTTVRLSRALETIGHCAFYGCTALARVTPLLPDSLQAFSGSLHFKGCPIEGDCLWLRNPGLTCIPDGDSATGTFFGSRFKKVDMTGSGITFVGTHAFRANKQLGEVIFPPTLTALCKNCAFYDCTALTNAVLASCPADAADALTTGGMPFPAANDYGFRIQICYALGDWAPVIAAIGPKLNAADADPESANAAKYRQNFADHADVVPLGTVNVSWKRRWIARYALKPAEVKFAVTGAPEALGDGFVNGYGDYGAVTSPLTCAAPALASLDGVAYACDGYVLQSSGDDGWADVESGRERTYTFDRTEFGFYRLIWQWKAVAYTLSVADLPAALGTVSRPPPDYQGAYYTAGSRVTVSATPAAGRAFGRWYGDTGGADATSPAIELTMDGNRSLTPYVKGPWTHDPAAKTVSNGYWTFGADGPPDALTVKSVKAAGAVTDVDFSTGLDGGAFAGIDGTFYGNGDVTEVKMADTMTSIGGDTFRAAPKLRKVTLSAALETVGACAFFDSKALSEVTPFLPDSVTAVGDSAFYNCRSLVVPSFTLGKGMTHGFRTHGTYPAFYNVRFGRIDLSRSGLRTLGNAFMIQNDDLRGNLAEVILPKTFAGMDVHCFRHQGVHTVFETLGGPFDVADSSFYGYGEMANVFVLPKTAEWVRHIAANGATAELSAAEREAFGALFPSVGRPRQKVRLPGDGKWQYLAWKSASGLVVRLR